MKYVNHVEKMKPDDDERSLRSAVKDRESEILRDTYFLVDPENSPSKNLKMGYTVIYPGGKTTGHSHPQHEEVYYIMQGKGRMVVDKTEYDINTGDALYVPFGAFHVTYNTGNQPLQMIWTTGEDKTIGT